MKRNFILFLFATSLLVASCNQGSTSDKSEKDKKNEQDIEQTDENQAGLTKANILEALIGEHKLQSANALLGANTMVDYYIEDGQWYASGSANEGGERFGYDIDLDEDELDKLQTMKIVVDDDLTVNLYCQGEPIFRIPFIEDGMDFNLEKPVEDYIMMPEGLSEETLVEGSYLYIYALDMLSEDIMDMIDVLGVYGDVVVIRYDMVL